jgi:nucleotide-binding universal stress UspA family protein
MFKRILVPLDGSGCAAHALPVAARLARASGGSVILVRVVTTSTEFWPYQNLTPQAILAQTVVDADLAEAERYLSEYTRTPDLERIPTETAVLLGPAVPTLLSVARSYHADVIVLCSHGSTSRKRWGISGVAEHVARHSPVPVLILRDGVPLLAESRPHGARPLRALVALDGSARAEAALEPAASLIAALAAPAPGALRLARVVKPMAAGREGKHLEERDDGAHVLQQAGRYLSATVNQLHEGLVAPAVVNLKLSFTWSVAVDTDVAEALIGLAENKEGTGGAGVVGSCDVIAIATHGRSWLARLAVGSVTERVLHTTRLPLLVVRPPDMLPQVSSPMTAHTLV